MINQQTLSRKSLLPYIAAATIFGGGLSLSYVCITAAYSAPIDSRKATADVESLIRNHNMKAAVQLATAALAKDPRNVYLLVQRGRAYSAQRQRELAMVDFNASLKIRPTAEAYVERSNLYRGLEEPSKALKDMQEALKLAPESAIHLYVAQLQYELGDAENCIANAKQAITKVTADRAHIRSPEHLRDLNVLEAASYEVIGRVYLQKQNSAKAIEHLNKAFALLPDYTKASKTKNRALMKKSVVNVTTWISERGEAYERAGKYKEAIADYELVSELYPKNFVFNKLLLRAYQKANEYQKALAQVNRMILDDDSPYLYYKRSEIYKKLGKEDLAKKDFERARRSEDGFMNSTPSAK